MEHRLSDDEEMLAGIGRRESISLSLAFDLYAAVVARYAWALADDAHDAEEIVQDTFVTLWEKAPRVALVDSSLLPWLLTTARNHAMNAYRRKVKHRAVRLPDELEDPGSHRDDARDRLRWVMHEINQLADLDRRVCELCLVEGRPYGEVADLLGISAGAVKQRVSRNRSRLRKAVNDNA